MNLLFVICSIVYVISSFFLIFVVLIQKGEGGGLGGAFGGGAVDKAFGAKADTTWKRATSIAASLFFLLAIFLGILQNHQRKGSIAGASAETQQGDEAAEGDGVSDTLQNPGMESADDGVLVEEPSDEGGADEGGADEGGADEGGSDEGGASDDAAEDE